MSRGEIALYGGLALTVLGGLISPIFVFFGLSVAALGAWAADKEAV